MRTIARRVQPTLGTRTEADLTASPLPAEFRTRSGASGSRLRSAGRGRSARRTIVRGRLTDPQVRHDVQAVKVWAYWLGVCVLIAVGYVAIFSVGAPFLLFGLTLALLFPWRHRRGVMPTGVAAVVGFVMGYVLVAPLSCTRRVMGTAGEATGMEMYTACSNLLGIPYEGTGSYDPSLLPALLAGITLALLAAALTAWLSRRRTPQPTAAASS